MVLSDSLQFRKRLHWFALKGQALFCLLAIPALLWGQSGAVTSDSLRAERLLTRGLELRDNGHFNQSSVLLTESADLFRHSGYLYKAAHCYNHISSNLRQEEKPDSAEVAAHLALKAISELSTDDPTEQIRAYTNLGLIESDRARYDQSLAWLQKARRLIDHPSVSPFLKTTVMGSLGVVYDDLGNYDRALSYYSESLDILAQLEDPPKGRMAKLYNNIGYTYTNKGLYSRSLEFYKKELELNLEIKKETHPDVAIAYINIGSGYYRRGDYGQAVLYFRKSLEAALNAFGEEHLTTLTSYENLAACYVEAEQYDKAIANFKQSAEIKERMRGPDHPDLAITYKNLGSAYARQEKYRQALSYNRQALNIQRRSLGEHHPHLVDTYNNMGDYFALQHQPDSAFYYLNKAEALARSSLNSRHPALAHTYAALAKTSEVKGRYREADTFYQKALAILSDDPGPAGFSSVASIQYPVYAVDILFDKARMLGAAYNDESDIRYLEASLSTFELLSRLLDNLQIGYVNEQSKLTIGRKSHKIYEHAIQVAYDLYQEKKDRTYPEKIFFFAEKSKARILLESVVKNGAKQYSSIPDSLLEYERSLEGQMNAIHREMDLLIAGSSAQSERISSLRDSLISLNQQLMQHKNRLDLQFPRYHTLKYANPIPSVSHIRKRLPEKNLTVVEYFLGEESLFAMVLTENVLTVRKLAFDEKLTSKIYAFNQAITQRDDSLYRMLGYSLYCTLVEPIEPLISSSNSRRLLIVPDGEMALLPFEALLTYSAPATVSNYRDFPYLLWEYDIAYAPSLALSSVLQNQKDRSYEANFLAFAPGFTSADPGWQDQAGIINRSAWRALPFSKREVTDIASLFNNQMEIWDFLFGTSQITLFLDEDASESALKSAAGLDARYIHLATHAFVSDDQSKPAGILLYPDKSLNEDGILFAHEIYSLSMNTDLVVLSACETGRGSVVKGEGIMSLSRAFQFAGAENLLVSLWKVEDRSSAKLMVEFYRRLINRKDKISALQDAKRNLVQGVEFAHPFYWAPFILIGN